MQGVCAAQGGVMVLVARLAAISNQNVPETRITPRLKVQHFGSLFCVNPAFMLDLKQRWLLKNGGPRDIGANIAAARIWLKLGKSKGQAIFVLLRRIDDAPH
jgi:hypothetical protein